MVIVQTVYMPEIKEISVNDVRDLVLIERIVEVTTAFP